MARRTGPVLVDTNIIIECWRIGAWKALAGGYAVETVATCFIETQTGAQRRRPELRLSLPSSPQRSGPSTQFKIRILPWH